MCVCVGGGGGGGAHLHPPARSDPESYVAATWMGFVLMPGCLVAGVGNLIRYSKTVSTSRDNAMLVCFNNISVIWQIQSCQF